MDTTTALWRGRAAVQAGRWDDVESLAARLADEAAVELPSISWLASPVSEMFEQVIARCGPTSDAVWVELDTSMGGGWQVSAGPAFGFDQFDPDLEWAGRHPTTVLGPRLYEHEGLADGLDDDDPGLAPLVLHALAAIGRGHRVAAELGRPVALTVVGWMPVLLGGVAGVPATSLVLPTSRMRGHGTFHRLAARWTGPDHPRIGLLDPPSDWRRRLSRRPWPQTIDHLQLEAPAALPDVASVGALPLLLSRRIVEELRPHFTRPGLELVPTTVHALGVQHDHLLIVDRTPVRGLAAIRRDLVDRGRWPDGWEIATDGDGPGHGRVYVTAQLAHRLMGLRVVGADLFPATEDHHPPTKDEPVSPASERSRPRSSGRSADEAA